MSHSATNLTQRKPRCPFCSFTRCWRLRRDRRKCKRCRREWSPRRPLCQGFRATESQWRTFLGVFLEERRSVRIAERLRLERRTVHRMAAVGEYVRGRVHTNGIESFWGYLKRRLKTTGGIRRERLRLYVAEEVWRFNHRRQTLDEQVDTLVSLLVARK